MKTALIATIVASSVAAFAARADEIRKIDFTSPIVVDGKPVIDDILCPVSVDQNDKPIKDAKGETSRPCETPYTVGAVAFYSLRTFAQGQDWQSAIRRYDLGVVVRHAEDYPATRDQLDTIEKAMGPNWTPSILAAARAIMDPGK